MAKYFKKCQPQESSKYASTKNTADDNFNVIFSHETFTGFSPMTKV